ASLYFLVGIFCLWEFSGLVLKQDSKPIYNTIRRVFAVLLGIAPALLIINRMTATLPLIVDYSFWLFPLLFASFLFELFAASSKPFENIAFNMLGIVYIGIPTTLLVSMPLTDESGMLVILALILMVWASDVFAYLLGSKIGKHKMFPRISPKKTWEGTFSGVIGAMVTGVLCFYVFAEVRFSLTLWLVLGATCTIFGILGDLVESMLKRSLGIKDSGTILPGHGGFLDRFDAFIFAVPFAAFVIEIMDGRF
ncbi:MAG: phosphatidate cytidylyltransferase, partial [Saprospiraceae bacterium]|nr:phosphatidate cytidylyltransferase [Saprospiraceae bacterium]